MLKSLCGEDLFVFKIKTYDFNQVLKRQPLLLLGNNYFSNWIYYYYLSK